jgi:hypothetical protein
MHRYRIVPKLRPPLRGWSSNFRTLLEPALDAKVKPPEGGLHLALHGTDSLNHLVWHWAHNYNYWGYHLLFLLGIINFYKYNALLVFYLAGYILFKMSISGEIWCFLVTGIPLLNLLVQKMF